MKEDLIWQVRHFVYQNFANTSRPPSVEETAQHFNTINEEAKDLYLELHNRHAFFLDVDKMSIRMASPFSGIETDFKVHANEKTYFANCAWDMVGIPAALHSDAVIEAKFTGSDDEIKLEVKDGKVSNGDLLVHFPLPFSRWYDDLVFT